MDLSRELITYKLIIFIYHIFKINFAKDINVRIYGTNKFK